MSSITNLICEYRRNPLGIDVMEPRLGWQLSSDQPNTKQTAYRIFAASSPDKLAEGQTDVWDSGKVDSDQSVHVVYAGPRLDSRQRVYWKVLVWDQSGAPLESEAAWFEVGLLRRRDWKARWIGGELLGGPRTTVPQPYLRKPFALEGKVASARLYVTALGFHECSINGQVVGEDVFGPGWTDYNKRVQYKVYDVGNLLRQGDNVLGAVMGDGWAVGFISWGPRQEYIDRPRLLAQLEITLEDGNKITIVSDRTWKHRVGPLLETDMLAGEAYDARLEMPGWDRAGFDDKRWTSVEVFGDHPGQLVATNGPTVQRISEIQPIADPTVKRAFTASSAIYDMGQNMVGRVRIKGRAPAGTTLIIRYAEVLTEKGDLYTANLRSARCVDYYTFKGEGEEVWEPKFTFHGFRYVELLGFPGDYTRDMVTGIVLHSEMAQTGDFSCSDPTLNQLQHNILWGQKGNFVDVPTDCPQRDERLGWTGDIQVFIRTAAFNMDVAGFMTKWAQDVADAQSAQGMVPMVVPNPGTVGPDGGPAWSDACIICPWTIYLCYGDTRILEDNYEVMSKFMDYLLKTSPNLIRCAPDAEVWPGFGDWLSINAPLSRDLIGTAFLGHDANLMAQIATVLGKKNDAAKYRKLYIKVKDAFADRYLVGGTGVPAGEVPTQMRQMMEGADNISRGNLKVVEYETASSEVFNTAVVKPSQTAYVLGLHFNIFPHKLRAAAIKELVADIEQRGMHLSTGFVGASYLPHVLSSNERLDVAYALLNQKTWPSWLYAVTQGATTIWERWDGYTAENGFQDPGMNSFNHYAYGSIGAWMYNTVAGIEIDPQQPGYKHTLLRPQPGGGLTHANASLKTLYGELRSDWTLDGGKFEWHVRIPANTTASAYVPVPEGTPIVVNGQSVDSPALSLGPGQHHIVAG